VAKILGGCGGRVTKGVTAARSIGGGELYTYQAKETVMARKQAARSSTGTDVEIPELNVSAEELARMHPLVKMAIDFINRDAVETTTHYDGQGNVISVKQKIKKSPNRARTFHSLLNAVRPLIKLEQEWFAKQPQRSGYDLDGEVTGADGGGASPDSGPAFHCYNPPHGR
jgi:hypothetical protein